MPSALKNELREVFLDQVRSNKALNEHITIPLPKVSSPRCILGSCTGRWERRYLPLIKKTWLPVLAFGACVRCLRSELAFGACVRCSRSELASPSCERPSGGSAGRAAALLRSPSRAQRRHSKAKLPRWTVPSSRRGWTLEIRVSVIMVTASLGLGSQHEGSFGGRRHGSEPHRNSRAPAPLR